MEDLKYGLKDVAYSGCEVIAVYNAEVALSGEDEPEDVAFVDLLNEFENNGSNIFDHVHTMCISETASDSGEIRYVIHNDFTLNKSGNNSASSIQGLVNDYNGGISEPISIIGITKD